jgi:Carboxypeptidase regulatory-like domain/TonB dependent receptor
MSCGRICLRVSPAVRFVILSLLFLSLSVAQSPNGTISGIIHDPSERPIPDAEIIIVNDLTNIQYQTKTNDEGIYVVPDLPPGPYRIQVTKRGFKTLIKPGLVLNVQDALSVSITLPLGAVNEVVTVEGGAPMINTTDGSVSTVVDREFAENLPMNGRSFQTLIQLAPGVVATPSSSFDSGQFSVNGQRPNSNYWMVDGVSANIGVGAPVFGNPANGFGGAAGSFSALGGTNSLVSVDAMEEFRIQTSTYAPEFGRTPGGQISIVTRSGTNQFHGTVFDYFRNDVLDANNWFNTSVAPALPKAEERQNDFGGTLGGRILKDRTFFFFSYEGLRLRLPSTALTHVPDLAARQAALPAIQPYLNAFPLPNGPDNPITNIAQLNASYSNPAALDAYSIRVDHKVGDRLILFGRYNYSPSEFEQRGGTGSQALSVVVPARITTQTATAGMTWGITPALTNDLRYNYSHVNAESHNNLDNFEGAIPLPALPFPTSFTSQNSLLEFCVFPLGLGACLNAGENIHNLQRQNNLVDGLSWHRGSHIWKWGVDFRRLTPVFSPPEYFQEAAFLAMSSAEAGRSLSQVRSQKAVDMRFSALGAYAQDNWRIQPRLTLTYGVRWDVEFAPSSSHGLNIPAVTGYSPTDLSQLALAPTGKPPYETTFKNLAPRIGLAWQVSQNANWQTVFRGAFGVFYDLVSSEVGNITDNASLFPPFGVGSGFFAATFPLTPTQAAPPSIPPSGTIRNISAFSPNLKSPYTLEWNVALEQSIGKEQVVSVSYVAAAGRRLLQITDFLSPSTNPAIQEAVIVGNTATSDYNALQVQFRRRLSSGLQVLASYTWSHSIDDASDGFGSTSDQAQPGAVNSNRGDSSFDIRNAFTAGVTYEVPVPRWNRFSNTLLHGWSAESFVLARSAPPVDLGDINFSALNSGIAINIRPDLLPGRPLYLYGPQYPGGKAFNPSAFTAPPADPNTGNPLRQGSLGRNALRGFGAEQWDFAVHREFPIRDVWKLQFRAEMFNVLNHPNFGPPNGELGSAGFGLSSQTLNQSLSNGNLGAGGFSPLYQIGGPRSIQLALKLTF